MRRSTKIILSVSLIANLLLVGVIGGAAYKKWSARPWHEVKKQLEPESRNVVARTFQDKFREIRPIGKEARKVRGELIKVMTAEEFDPEAFDEAAAELTSLRDRMAEIKLQATKDILSQLPKEEREKMAHRMAEKIGGGIEHKVRRDRHVRPRKPGHKPDFEKAEPDNSADDGSDAASE